METNYLTAYLEKLSFTYVNGFILTVNSDFNIFYLKM